MKQRRGQPPSALHPPRPAAVPLPAQRPSPVCIFKKRYCLPACRFQIVSLVSKRLAAVCLEPELLRSLKVDIHCLQAVARLQALLQFLTAHARHVRSLGLTATRVLAKADKADLSALVMGCLAAIGAAGALEELQVRTSLGSTAWLPALTKLRTLDVHSAPNVRLPPGFSKLTMLVDVRLTSLSINAPTLPISLTALKLADLTSTAPPPQVRLPSV